MGYKERQQRYKDNTYKGILDAAMIILKTDGCESISIRKIAGKIDYSAPIIYSYFLNKEAILIELSKLGFIKLTNCLEKSLIGISSPGARIKSMLLAHIHFAKKESELYRLMFSIGFQITDVEETFPILTKISNLFRKELLQLTIGKSISENSLRENYLTCLSFVHGLATLNLYFKNIDTATNSEIMENAVYSIFRSVTQDWYFHPSK